jgi:hypothetical protein
LHVSAIEKSSSIEIINTPSKERSDLEVRQQYGGLSTCGRKDFDNSSSALLSRGKNIFFW